MGTLRFTYGLIVIGQEPLGKSRRPMGLLGHLNNIISIRVAQSERSPVKQFVVQGTKGQSITLNVRPPQTGAI